MGVGGSTGSTWGDVAARVGGDLLSTYGNYRGSEKLTHDQMDFEQMMWARNADLQREFAKNGLRWKIEDAAAAGIHPLAAIGAGTVSASPISVGGISGAGSKGASMLAGMGQSLSRSVNATMTEEERAEHTLRLALLAAQIKETDMRGKLIEEEINRNNKNSLNSAPFPSGDGQVTVVPDQKISAALVDKSRTAGKGHPMFKSYETGLPGPFRRMDVLYSQEGPAEGLEGVGGILAFLVRNGLVRPGRWMGRAAAKGYMAAERKYHEFTQ